jgi:hypothetical protein
MIEAVLGKKRDPISKVTRTKRTESMAQAIDCLPSKCEALSSNSSTTKKKERKKKELIVITLKSDNISCPSL